MFLFFNNCLFLNSEVNSVLQSPTLVTHQISSGDVLFAMVFKPHNFVPGQKYPTILHVYGGTEVQLVTNTFKVHLYNNSLIFIS